MHEVVDDKGDSFDTEHHPYGVKSHIEEESVDAMPSSVAFSSCYFLLWTQSVESFRQKFLLLHRVDQKYDDSKYQDE